MSFPPSFPGVSSGLGLPGHQASPCILSASQVYTTISFDIENPNTALARYQPEKNQKEICEAGDLDLFSTNTSEPPLVAAAGIKNRIPLATLTLLLFPDRRREKEATWIEKGGRS